MKAQTDLLVAGNFQQKISTRGVEQEQHPLGLSAALHLLPGAIVFLVYMAIAPHVMGWGFPATFALVLCFLFIGIPMQLGVLYYHGRKRNGSFSLKGIVLYRNAKPFRQYLLILPLLAYAIVLSVLYEPVATFLTGSLFSSLPGWFFDPSALPGTSLPQALMLVFLISVFIIDGIVNPVVEEMYYRGYLLPRISHFRGWAPALNAVLFSVAHFWQPQNALYLFLLTLPLYYLVWWRRNIYLSIGTHTLANIIGALLLIGAHSGST